MSVSFNLDGFLPYRIAGLAEQLNRAQSRLLEDHFGLSQAQFYVLVQLQGDGSVSVREIHDRIDMDKPKVSRAASRLAERGLITKRSSLADRRLVELSLTKKGRDMLADLGVMSTAHHDGLLDKLGPDAAPFLRAIDTLSLPQDD
jgi:DNA-binding MarR family transcriptional regulator